MATSNIRQIIRGLIREYVLMGPNGGYRSMAGGGDMRQPRFDVWPEEGYGLNIAPEDDPALDACSDDEFYNGRVPQEGEGDGQFEWTGLGCDVCGYGTVESQSQFDPERPCPECGVVMVVRQVDESRKITDRELHVLISEVLVKETSEDELDKAAELARTPEYKSCESLAEYLIDDDRTEFTHVDLRALGMRTKRSISDLRKELEAYGLTLATRQPEKRVRGFNTSSNDRWYGPGSIKTHGGSGIDPTTGRAGSRGTI